MADLREIVLHYSRLAYQVRILALSSVGAAVGASVGYFKDPIEANLLGAAVIVIVGCLSALNQRYTHSYVAASYAAGALPPPLQPGSDPETDRWHAFRVINERPYQNPAMRSLLNWSTYSPGVLAGWYFIFRDGPSRVTIPGWLGLVLSIVFLVLWWHWSRLRPDVRVPLLEDRGKWV